MARVNPFTAAVYTGESATGVQAQDHLYYATACLLDDDLRLADILRVPCLVFVTAQNVPLVPVDAARSHIGSSQG